MSSSTGTPWCSLVSLLVIRPPSTTVCSLIAATVVWAVVASMIGERITWPVGEVKIGMPVASDSSSDFSASICMTTSPSGLMRGVTPRINPTLSKVMEFVLPVSGVDRDGRDPRHPLPDLDEGGLVVEGHDLRPLEDVHAMVFRQGAKHGGHVLAGGGEHQAAVAQRAVRAADAEVRDPLAADG